MSKNNKTVRYVCHGCGNTAGYFDKPVHMARIVCPKCGKDQHTKLENFILLTDEQKAALQ